VTLTEMTNALGHQPLDGSAAPRDSFCQLGHELLIGAARDERSDRRKPVGAPDPTCSVASWCRMASRASSGVHLLLRQAVTSLRWVDAHATRRVCLGHARSSAARARLYELRHELGPQLLARTLGRGIVFALSPGRQRPDGRVCSDDSVDRRRIGDRGIGRRHRRLWASVVRNVGRGRRPR
jgi:hypothetical protein